MSGATRGDRRHERLLPDTWRRPVLGVLGGMGSAATVAFLDALVRATSASTDQEHIDSVVLNHATVPDRTARLHDPSQPDPTPYLLGDLELLARLGADRAVIVCNTAHAFLDEGSLPLPLLSIVEVGADAVLAVARRRGGERPTVTVLATDGTLSSRLYQDALERRGATVRVPGESDQPRVMSMIYDRVKADVPVPSEEFAALVEELGAGSDAVLLGCTELSVLYAQAAAEDAALPVGVVDAQSALVRRVVDDLGPDAREGASRSAASRLLQGVSARPRPTGAFRMTSLPDLGPRPWHVVLMGVSGTGKSSIAAALLEHLDWDFCEGDALHLPENIAKMSRGQPLDDEDRWAWLEALAGWTRQRAERGEDTLLTCSALKRSYRDVLRRGGAGTFFVHLTGDHDLLAERMGARQRHFMPSSMLRSQLDTLEPLDDDERGMVVDVAASPEEIARRVMAQLGR